MRTDIDGALAVPREGLLEAGAYVTVTAHQERHGRLRKAFANAEAALKAHHDDSRLQRDMPRCCECNGWADEALAAGVSDSVGTVGLTSSAPSAPTAELGIVIARHLMFKGKQTCNEFLQGNQGIASNILADRLRKLEAVGIVGKRVHPSGAQRYIYRLSAKGIDQVRVLGRRVRWSARHEASGVPAPVFRAMRNEREAFIAGVRQRWRSGR